MSTPDVRTAALIDDLVANGAISEIGLHLADPNLSYDRYEALCYWLGRVHEMVRFAIGDAIRLGESLFGENAYQAIEALNLSEKARWEYVRVAAKVPRSIRRKDLSWSHHRVVANLNPVEQRQWLQTAADRGLGHHALRAAVGQAEPAPVPSRCHCCGRRLDV